LPSPEEHRVTQEAHLEATTDRSAGLLGMRQVADALGRMTSRRVEFSPDGASFRSIDPAGASQGVLSISGALVDGSVVETRIELARVSPKARGSWALLFEELSGLDEKVRVLEPSECAGGCSLAVELRTHASPLSFQRETVLQGVVTKLDEMARHLQAELPAVVAHADLDATYKPFEKALAAIYPATDREFQDGSERAHWATQVHEYLASGSSVALSAECTTVQNLALALVAHAAPKYATSMGRVILPTLNAMGLCELAKTAPGRLVVPALQLSMGAHPYELNNEMESLLAAISQLGRGVVFVGSSNELSRAFRGGQGGSHSPIDPIVMHPPSGLELADYAEFGVRMAAREMGGLSAPQAAEVVQSIRTALEAYPLARQLELLPRLVNQTLSAVATGRPISSELARSHASRLDGLSETLGGLSHGSRGARSAKVQSRCLNALCDAELPAFLRGHLFAQDRALGELTSRLRTEVLTRPLHQPLRYLAQGTPGNGKSESARLLANRLGAPFVNIDAASMSDYQTASAQLLGSGRGIVGSHEPGRLEMAAKHHAGAVIEVSDLDHATPSVRQHLADLFLQALEVGEVQAATGAMISCANLLIVFTINLPAGYDERVRRSMGFGGAPSQKEVRQRVIDEVAKLLSRAFVSRVGTPILFDPLSRDSLAQIARRAVAESVASALSRLEMEPAEISVDLPVGEAIAAAVDVDLSAYGARGLVERARALAAEAVLTLEPGKASAAGKRVEVRATETGMLTMKLR